MVFQAEGVTGLSPHKTLPVTAISGDFSQHNLDSPVLIQKHMARQPYLAHPALSKLPFQQIRAAKNFPGLQHIKLRFSKGDFTRLC
jgi:hypothetical protein